MLTKCVCSRLDVAVVAAGAESAGDGAQCGGGAALGGAASVRERPGAAAGSRLRRQGRCPQSQGRALRLRRRLSR